MPLPFLAMLAIQIILFVASALLAPKPNFPDATPEDPQGPRTKEGEVLPVIFGTVKMSANVSYFGNVRAHEQTEHVKTGIFSSKNVTVGFIYDAFFQVILCHGPIDEILDIVWDSNKSTAEINLGPEEFGPIDTDGDSIPDSYGVISGGTFGGKTFPAMPLLRSEDVTPDNGQLFTMQYAQGMFGGSRNGGGLSGKFTLYWGTPNQLTSPTMSIGVLGTSQYNQKYEGVAHVVFGFMNSNPPAPTFMEWFSYGERSVLPGIEFIVRRCPSNLGLSLAQTNLNGAANPAEMLYECLINTTWGLGVPIDQIDVDSFQAAGLVLAAENFGLNMSLNSGEAGDSIISEILRYVDGQVQQHPVTGLIEFTLNRKDYITGDLPILNEGNVTSCQHTRPLWSTLKNEVRVIWTQQRGVFLKQVATQPVQDIAAQRNFAEVNAITVQYPAVMDGVQANVLAVRDLRLLSTPLGKIKIETNRTAADFRVGRPFVFGWADYGITARVFRVASVDYGTLTDGRIIVDAIEDIFGLEDPMYAIPVEALPLEDRIGSQQLVQVDPVPTEDPSTGYLTLNVGAGTGLVTSVQFKSQSGNRTPTAWLPSQSMGLFFFSVDKHSTLQSSILWRVQGHKKDGTIGVIADGAVQFDKESQPQRPLVTVFSGSTTALRSARIVLDSDTISIKYVMANNTEPTLASVQAAAPIALTFGQTVYNIIDLLSAGGDDTTHVAALAYDQAGNESNLGRAQIKHPLGPDLIVRVTVFDTTYSIVWSGSGVTLSINGGTPTTPPASPIVVARNLFGGAPKEYVFYGLRNGQSFSVPVTIAQQSDKSIPRKRFVLGATFLPRSDHAAPPVGTFNQDYYRLDNQMQVETDLFLGYAEVMLPDGAELTFFNSWTGMEGGATGGAAIWSRFKKIDFTSGLITSFAYHINTDNVSNAMVLQTTDLTSVGEIVDNSSFAYWLELSLIPGTGDTTHTLVCGYMSIEFIAPTVTTVY